MGRKRRNSNKRVYSCIPVRRLMSNEKFQGKIIKGIAGSYYVHVVGAGIYECKAKGIFRYKNIKPLVGDNVELDILNEEEKTGNITDIIKRKNSLIRPAVANIDQAMVIFAVKSPSPNLNLLDRFLVMMEAQNIPVIICFNKTDLADEAAMEELKKIYKPAGYNMVFTSTACKTGLEQVKAYLDGKTTVFAGPSGVGKSSMLNTLIPDINAKTGAVSRKIERGKHTTRHSEIFNLERNTYIMDTPGFSSVYAWAMEKEELKALFPEFVPCEGGCRFNGCVHVNEPECMVKRQVEEGKIASGRYENYILMYDEIKNRKKY